MQGKEAADYVNALIPTGASLSQAFSTTLIQTGIVDALKARSDVNNFKAKAVAAMASGDTAGYAKFARQGASADFFLSGVAAITADGNLHCVDASGSRLSGWHAAGKLVVVASTSKIVSNDAEAEERVGFQYQLESARVRVAYGIPHSSLNNRVVMRSGNPWGPRVIVVLISEEALGF